MSDEELEKYYEDDNIYESRESQAREILYESIDRTTIQQIKREKPFKKMWDKLIEIKLQTLRFNPEDESDIMKHTSR